MRVLCLDIGEKRIGVACGESSIGLATPLTTISRKTWDEDCAAVRRLFAEQEAEALVIGLPVSLDGALHYQGERIREEGERLGDARNLLGRAFLHPHSGRTLAGEPYGQTWQDPARCRRSRRYPGILLRRSCGLVAFHQCRGVPVNATMAL